VATGKPRRGCEIKAVVQQIRETRLRRIGNIKRPASEKFIEKPGAPVGCAGRGTSHECGDGILRDGFEEPFQDEQIDVFVAQRESQLVAEGLAGPVPLVEDVPTHLLTSARLNVLFGYSAWEADGGMNTESLDEGRPSGQPCIRWYRLLLERPSEIISTGMIFSGHGRKPLFSVERNRHLRFLVENQYT